LAALSEAEKRGAQIVVTTAGGKLMERAKEANHPLFEIPAVFSQGCHLFIS
jgi:hypothetical protein